MTTEDLIKAVKASLKPEEAKEVADRLVAYDRMKGEHLHLEEQVGVLEAELGKIRAEEKRKESEHLAATARGVQP